MLVASWTMSGACEAGGWYRLDPDIQFSSNEFARFRIRWEKLVVDPDTWDLTWEVQYVSREYDALGPVEAGSTTYLFEKGAELYSTPNASSFYDFVGFVERYDATLGMFVPASGTSPVQAIWIP